ncbi:NAD(P)-binding protein [Astrocystis sublimbata]|nr:NAD(P)-binding protein [Astrocystis sublimbata]
MSLDPDRLTNWPAVRDFVPTAYSDTYSFIATSGADLSDKSVFITGASKGIGKGIALSFAQAGCSRIAVAARTGVDELKKEILSAARAAGRPEPHVLAIAVDATSSEGVAAAAATVSEAFGGVLDILINNAGRTSAMVPLDQTDVDDWWGVWELNIRATYLCTRAFISLLLKSSLRTVIVVSSAGAHMLIKDLLGYQTSKTTLCRFAEFLAKDYEDQRLQVIAVHPGDVMTEAASVVPDEWAPIFKDKPQLTGDTLVWLTKERREWLNGRFVSVTWDMQELEQKRDEVLAKDLLKMRLTV